MPRLLALDVFSGKFKISEFSGLDDFYAMLDASFFDIVRRKIGGKEFDVFVDDCGLIEDGNPIISAICNDDNTPALVGNLIFANRDSSGRTISLSDNDVMLIIRHTLRYVDPFGRHRTVVMCD